MSSTQSFLIRAVAQFPQGLALLLALSLANVSEAQRPPNGGRQEAGSSIKPARLDAAPGKSKPDALTLEKDPRGSTDHESFRFTYQPGDAADAIHGILLKPQGDGSFPAVIVNHGGGGNPEGFGRQFGSLFVAKRYVVIAAELTHAGQAQGDMQTFAGSQQNADRIQACIAALESLPYVDAKRLGMFGHSMGAFATVGACTQTDKIRAAAISAGGLRPRGMLDTAANVPKITTPFLILHGTTDQTVNVEWGKDFKAALDAHKKTSEMKLFEGVGHDLPRTRQNEVFGLILAFFDKHFQAKRPVGVELSKDAKPASAVAADRSAHGGSKADQTPTALPPSLKTDSPPSAGSDTGRRPMPQITFDQWLHRFDANKDAKVSKDEFTGQPQAFQGMDANSDGIVDQAEFQKSRQNWPRSGRSGANGKPPTGTDGDSPRRRTEERIGSQGVKVGAVVPDADVFTLEGNAVRLSSLWKEKPLVLVTASITCPISVDSCPSLKPLKELHDARVNFAILYVREAHPAEDGQARPPGSRTEGAVESGSGSHAQPATLAARRQLAAAFAKHFSGTAPVYVADIGNSLPQRLGTGANTGLLIGTDGKLHLKQPWFDAAKMSAAVTQLLDQ